MINRTAERVLSIIAASFTLFSIIGGVIGAGFFTLFKNDQVFRMEFEKGLYEDPAMTAESVDFIFSIIDFLAGVVWFIVVIVVIALILAIVGIVNIWNNKNPKLAGVLFIVAGVLNGILNVTSILFYIAGILCFTKKPPLTDDHYVNNDSYDDSMRPL